MSFVLTGMWRQAGGGGWGVRTTPSLYYPNARGKNATACETAPSLPCSLSCFTSQNLTDASWACFSWRSHSYLVNILASATSRWRNNGTSLVLTSTSSIDAAVLCQVLMLRVVSYQESQIRGWFVEMGTWHGIRHGYWCWRAVAVFLSNGILVCSAIICFSSS